MMDSGILPGVYNHIVIAVHFQKINSVCVCVSVSLRFQASETSTSKSTEQLSRL